MVGKENPLKSPPSFSHTRTEDPIPRAPAHQRPEFLQHFFFHEYKHRSYFISVPARRGNNEKGEETGRDSRGDSQASGRKEVVQMSEGRVHREGELLTKKQGSKREGGGVRTQEKAWRKVVQRVQRDRLCSRDHQKTERGTKAILSPPASAHLPQTHILSGVGVGVLWHGSLAGVEALGDDAPSQSMGIQT